MPASGVPVVADTLDPSLGASDRTRHALLHQACDLIPHLVWIMSADGTAIEYVNRHAAAYTRDRPDSYQGADWRWLDLIHPDDAAALRADWGRLTAAATAGELRYRLRRADDTYRWHHGHVVPLVSRDGRVAGWVVTATDIDEQVALQQRLHRSRAETEMALAVLDSLPGGATVSFGLLDHDFRFLQANRALAEMDGVPVDDHPGRPVAELIPALWPQIEPACRHVRDTGEAMLGLETATVTADDPTTARSLIASHYPVRAGDTVVGVGVALVDVTQQRQAEEFRSVVMDNLTEGLYTIDDERRLTSLNQAAARMLGATPDKLVGTSLEAILPSRAGGASPGPDDECAILRVLSDGQPVGVTEGTFVRQDGSELAVSYSAAPLRVGGNVTGAVIVFQDITDIRQQQNLEVQNRHDQKLESLGRLSAGLAHEINTPIQFVGDNTRFLASAYQDMLELLLVYRTCMNSGELPWQDRKRLSDEAEEKADIEYLASEVPAAVEQSLQGIDRVASLVRAMKAFSYKDGNDRAYADLNEAIRTTVIVARNEVKYVADVILDLGELPEVLCHVGDLNQVFLNLLVNAADAMEGKSERGQITVTTRVEGTMAVLSFADNGSGIPEHLQRSVFDPFFTTKEIGKGTGQGLALTRAVVCDKHGGTIDLNSAPGQGTEFVLRLPVAGKRLDAP